NQQPGPNFQDLNLQDSIVKVVNEMCFESPSPIQAQTIPHLFRGEDVLGLAQTGTGITAAFALPLLANIDVSKN
ncbi:DEAD/DEAH box helicase, partial [Psychromonas aquatilis]